RQKNAETGRSTARRCALRSRLCHNLNLAQLHPEARPMAKDRIRAPVQNGAKVAKGKSGAIRAGIGGWTFAPWRGVFYPDKLAHSKELHYASRQLPTIEINGTYYGSQKPATFASWAAEAPDDFVFSVKGPRYATNRRVLAEAGDSIARFFDSGVT